MNMLDLPKMFAVNYYFAEIFGQNLEEIVKLSLLIPLIVIDNSANLLRDIVSGSYSTLGK
jgi:hypothetical protein